MINILKQTSKYEIIYLIYNRKRYVFFYESEYIELTAVGK